MPCSQTQTAHLRWIKIYDLTDTKLLRDVITHVYSVRKLRVKFGVWESHALHDPVYSVRRMLWCLIGFHSRNIRQTYFIYSKFSTTGMHIHAWQLLNTERTDEMRLRLFAVDMFISEPLSRLRFIVMQFDRGYVQKIYSSNA